MDWLSDHLAAVWLGIAILFGIAEMASLDLVLLMLAIGALIGVVLAVVGAPFALQAIAAALASVACLALVRPALVKKLHSGPDLTLGHGKLVGKQGVVTERITGMEAGRMKLAGEIWSAKPYDESLSIEPGATVEVLEIRGATVYVHPVSSIES